MAVIILLTKNMFHLISFPVIGIISFFFRKKTTENTEELVGAFLMALFLHFFLFFIAVSEAISLAAAPYFTEAAFSSFFVFLKIILIISQSTLVFAESQKKCNNLYRTLFSSLPFFTYLHNWLHQAVLPQKSVPFRRE